MGRRRSAMQACWLLILASAMILVDGAPVLPPALGESAMSAVMAKVDADHHDLEQVEEKATEARQAANEAKVDLRQVKKEQDGLVDAAEAAHEESMDQVDETEHQLRRMHDKAGLGIGADAASEGEMERRLTELTKEGLALQQARSTKLLEAERAQGNKVAANMKLDGLTGAAAQLGAIARNVSDAMTADQAAAHAQMQEAAQQAAKAKEEAAKRKAGAMEAQKEAAAAKARMEAELNGEKRKADTLAGAELKPLQQSAIRSWWKHA